MNAAQRRNTFVFEVDLRANKIEIRKAVEAKFDVTVVHVRTQVRKGKVKQQRRLGRRAPRGSDRKRAWVRLAEGQTIDLF
jgi:large subunit ribosomal protein L23